MAGPARERLIASTVALMRRDGVAATGIAELSEHSGVARRSIYNNFPGGKDELMAAATTSAGELMRQMIADVTATTTTPVEAITAFVEFWKYTLTASDFADGCPVMAGALAGTAAPSAPAAAADAFNSWESTISDQLRDHGCPDEIVQGLATMVVSTIEGAVMASLCKRDVAPLDAAQRYLSMITTAEMASQQDDGTG